MRRMWDHRHVRQVYRLRSFRPNWDPPLYNWAKFFELKYYFFGIYLTQLMVRGARGEFWEWQKSGRVSANAGRVSWPRWRGAGPAPGPILTTGLLLLTGSAAGFSLAFSDFRFSKLAVLFSDHQLCFHNAISLYHWYLKYNSILVWLWKIIADFLKW